MMILKKLSKEEFVRQIKEMQQCYDFDSMVYDASEKLGLELDIATSYLADNMIELLAFIMEDTNEDISYFCNELDFGRTWREGDIIDKDGNDIDFSTAEKLYDYLISA